MTQSGQGTKPQFRILIVSGPEKGTAYQLVSSQVRIGREKDNDIIISDDPHLSRHHAMVQVHDDQIEVIDVSKKNKITINNQKHERALLQDGMTFKVGTTEMKLERLNSLSTNTSSQPFGGFGESTEASMTRPVAPPPQPPLPPPILGSNLGVSVPPFPPRPAASNRRVDNNNRFMFYGIIAIVGIVLFLFFNTTSKKRGDSGLRSSEQVESTIKESQLTKEKLRQKVEKMGGNFQDAQALYIQGFRDYKKGQYSRAIDAFRGALAIYPDHLLAQRYLKLAHRRLDELIQFNMVQGRQFRARKMNERCVASFNSVLNLLNDKNSPTFKEAQELQEECSLQTQGRY